MSPDLDFKKLQQIDPLEGQPTIDFADQEGQSPMDPPDGYSPAVDTKFSYDEMHPYLQGLMDDHVEFTARLEKFAQIVAAIEADRCVSAQNFGALQQFIAYFNDDIIDHNRREERELFPLLRKRMLEHGEHSTGDDPTTPVTVLEREHVEAIQISAVAFAFLALAHHLKDEASTRMVLGIAIERAKSLIEMLKLHIFREDKIVFNMAQEFLTHAELDTMRTTSAGATRLVR